MNHTTQSQTPSRAAYLLQFTVVLILGSIAFLYTEEREIVKKRINHNNINNREDSNESNENFNEDSEESIRLGSSRSDDDDRGGRLGFFSSSRSNIVECADSPKLSRADFESDLEYVVENFKQSVSSSDPFDEIVYVCNVFPDELYEKIIEHFPGIGSMTPTEKGRCANEGDWKLEECKSYSAAGSNAYAERRWKLSGYDILQGTVNKDGFTNFNSAKETWRRVEEILFSEKFQNAIYDKLRLPEEYREKMVKGKIPTDFRLQTDKQGYAIGVHPDTPKKLATMQFYFPSDENAQESLYGTCVHTVLQYENRDMNNNAAAPCEKKFGFRHNSMYAFKVHETSYHSVEKVKDAGERKTLLVNWYRETPKSMGDAAVKQTKRRRTKGRGF